jgi:hypothetical protein
MITDSSESKKERVKANLSSSTREPLLLKKPENFLTK